MRTFPTAVLCLVATSLAAGTATAADPALYAAICDGTTAGDTVKIKRVDGGAVTQIADTGIADCRTNDAGTAGTDFTGLAVDGNFLYFSSSRRWDYSEAETAAGQTRIGRVGRDGSGLDPTFITTPVPARTLGISPVVADGHIYAYAANCWPNYCSGAITRTPRVIRVPVGGGSASTLVETPHPAYSGLSFGVGPDGVYYVLGGEGGDVGSRLSRVPLAGGAAATVLDLGRGPSDPDPFETDWNRYGNAANLAAFPGTTGYLARIKTGGEPQPGIGTFADASPQSTYSQYGAMPAQDKNARTGWMAPVAGSGVAFVRAVEVNNGPWTIGRAAAGSSPEYNSYPAAVTNAPIHGLAAYPAWSGESSSGSTGSGSGGSDEPTLDRKRIPDTIVPRYRNGSPVPDVDVPCTAGPGARLRDCRVSVTVDLRRLPQEATALIGEMAAKRPRRVVIGRAIRRAGDSGAETITVRVKITNPRARRALKKGTLRVQVALRATTTGGVVLTTTDTVVLRKATAAKPTKPGRK